MLKSTMTEKELAAVADMRAALKAAYLAAREARFRMNGFYDADADSHWSRARARVNGDPQAEMEQRAAKVARFEDARLYKERSDSKDPIIVRNPFEWVPDQLHTHAGMANLAEPMKNARQVLADKNVRKQIEEKGGDGTTNKYIERIGHLVATPKMPEGEINTILQGLLGLKARTVLAFRASSILKQRLGLLQASVEAGSGPLGRRILGSLAAVSNVLPSETKQALRAEIDKHSGYLAERTKPAFAAALQSAANPKLRVAITRLGRMWNATERAGLSGLQFADSDVVLQTYARTKDFYAKQGLTGEALTKKAVWETEKIVRESQNPTSVLDMSGYQLAGRQNALAGFMTLFGSNANKIRNQVWRAGSDWRADPWNKQKQAEFAKRVVLAEVNAVASAAIGYVFGKAGLEALIRLLAGERQEKDKKGADTKKGVGILADLAESVQPGAGTLLKGVTGHSYPGVTPAMRALQAGKGVVKAINRRGVVSDETLKQSIKLMESTGWAPFSYADAVRQGVTGKD